MKRLPHPVALTFVVLTVVACGTANAVAATNAGAKLTNDEYVLLGDSLAATDGALSGSNPNWQRARAGCLVLGQSTPLLKASRASCLGVLGESHAWRDASQEAQKCTHSPATGLAAAARGNSQMRQLVCLNPAYQALNRAVANLTVADRALRQSGIERGFTGHCLVTLVPTTQVLAAETGYLSKTKRLAADLSLYIRVRAGKAPRNAISGQTVLEAEVAVTPARDYWLGAQVGYPLSVCPHD